MNLRTKAASIVSVVALGLTMTAGIASAADPTTSATLANNANGACTISAAASGGNIGFGTWTWDGSAYVLSGARGTGTITLTQSSTDAPGVRDCEGVQIEASALQNTGVTAFDASAVHATGGLITDSSIGTVTQLLDSSSLTAATKDTEITITLEGDPEAVTPDTYTGTITFTLGDGI